MGVSSLATRISGHLGRVMAEREPQQDPLKCSILHPHQHPEPHLAACPRLAACPSPSDLLPTWALTTTFQPHFYQLQPERNSSHSGLQFLWEGTAGARSGRAMLGTETGMSRAGVPGQVPLLSRPPTRFNGAFLLCFSQCCGS